MRPREHQRRRGELSLNVLLWIAGLVGIGGAGLCIFVFFRMKVVDAPQESMLYAAGVFGGAGLLFLVPAMLGAGAATPMVKHEDAGRAARGEACPEGAYPGKGRMLPYFHARVGASMWNMNRTIYRVYVAESDLIFVSMHVKVLSPEQLREHTAGSMGGGLIPALIGAYAAAAAKEDLQRMTRALAHADEAVLRQFAAEDEESFIEPANAFRGPRIEPHSFWSKMFVGTDTVAVLRFEEAPAQCGFLTLPFLDDVTSAAAELSRLFGKDLAANLSWKSF